MMPGSRALAFASRWFDEQTVTRVFEPLVADWQREWQDAPPPARVRVMLRGLAAFVCAVIVSAPGVVVTPVPRDLTDRLATRMARFTLLASVILGFILLREMSSQLLQWPSALFLIPGVMALAFPFALIGAADAIRADARLPPHVARATGLKVAVLAAALMLVFGGWVIPAANQAWRTAVNPYPDRVPARGVKELNTLELIVHPERATAQESKSRGTTQRVFVQREISSRVAMIVLPVVLLWRRWRALDIARGHWYSPLPAALATVVMLFGFLFLRFQDWFVEEILNLPAGGAAWLPLAILLSAGMCRTMLARRAQGSLSS